MEKLVEKKDKFFHKFYKHCEEKDADACAWAWLDQKGDPTFFPYKLPELAEDEITIQIEWSGLCGSDVHKVRSDWMPSYYPIVPGHEMIGTISRIGAKVTNFKVGDRVGYGVFRKYCNTCDPCLRGDNQLCMLPMAESWSYDPYFGGFSTHYQGPAQWALHLPKALW